MITNNQAMKEVGEVPKSNQQLVVGARRLQAGTISKVLVGEIKQQAMTTGTNKVMMTEEILLPDLKDHLAMTLEEEAEVEAVVEVKVETLVVVVTPESASSVTKKATWQENVLMHHKMTEVEAVEAVVVENVSNAIKRDTWLGNVLTKIVTTVVKAEAVAEAEVEVMEEVQVDLEPATSATRRVTLLENVQTNLRILGKDLTRDREEMKLGVPTEGKMMKGATTGTTTIMTQVTLAGIMAKTLVLAKLGVLLAVGRHLKGANNNSNNKSHQHGVVGLRRRMIASQVGDKNVNVLLLIE